MLTVCLKQGQNRMLVLSKVNTKVIKGIEKFTLGNIWSEKIVCLGERERVENPVMTFPIKKRTDTKLLLDRLAALYIGETRIKVATNEGDQ